MCVCVCERERGRERERERERKSDVDTKDPNDRSLHATMNTRHLPVPAASRVQRPERTHRTFHLYRVVERYQPLVYCRCGGHPRRRDGDTRARRACCDCCCLRFFSPAVVVMVVAKSCRFGWICVTDSVANEIRSMLSIPADAPFQDRVGCQVPRCTRRIQPQKQHAHPVFFGGGVSSATLFLFLAWHGF